jgi:hypothetical protein
MASKKYLVREGFVVILALVNATNGSTYEKRYEGGEEVTLDDETAKAHMHKLEFASQKDRDAALAAEQEAKAAAAASQHPVDLVNMLTSALAQALQASGQAPAAPAA